MSFNVRGAYPERTDHYLWENRASLNVETIQKYDPDIIGFQEILAPNEDYYAKQLADYIGTAGQPKDYHGQWVTHNPIYYKKDRWKLIDEGGFFFSDTPDIWSKGWDAAYVRGATWVRLQSTFSGSQIIHINGHLDHVGELSRMESTRLLLKRLPDFAQDLPTILTADFNSRAWSPPDEATIKYPSSVKRDLLPPGGTVHGLLTGENFRDTYYEAGYQDQLDMNTFHGFLGEDFPPCALRIDWVMIRDGAEQTIDTDDFKILRDAQPPIYPSDHYPILAKLHLR